MMQYISGQTVLKEGSTARREIPGGENLSPLAQDFPLLAIGASA